MANPRPRILPEARESGGILPWVIAIMVFLLALVLAGGLALTSASDSWRDGLAQTITVRIDTPQAEERQRQVAAALDYLAAMPEVASARALSETELRALLEPWLGRGSFEADLPVPALVDVTLRPGDGFLAAALDERLRTVAPSAVVDDHQQWLGQINRIARSLQVVAAGIVLLVLVATIFVVTLATRSSLNDHRPTIEILHLIGAEDDLIAQEFQSRFLWHGLKGGVIGTLAGGLMIALLIRLATDLDGALGGIATPPWWLWSPLLLLPLLITGVTMMTARLTVRRALGAYL